jgi:Rrf2 family iron-sulfur cluster assembly transcriptional regulator
VRIAMSALEEEVASPVPESRLASVVIAPLVQQGTEAFLAELDKVTVEDLCNRAQAEGAVEPASVVDFTI